MANKDVFCNSPWFELHIFWNGDLGFCCHMNGTPYDTGTYNIKDMSIAEWYESEPIAEWRTRLLGNDRHTKCSRCYVQERFSDTSRRHKHNQKSVIFQKQNFTESFEQSPHYQLFSGTATVTHPVDIHIDLGNYCNLACKMCHAGASSKIAVQEIKWGNTDANKYAVNDWTKNKDVWDRVLAEIYSIQGLNNIHFMGGETLITPRFSEFLDYMIAHGKTNIGISFVSNGTVYDPLIVEKLKHFSRATVEISIETLTEHNAYQRQGTDTNIVIENIERYRSRFNVTLRPAISLLTIGTYHTVLEYALKNNLIVKSLPVTRPRSMNVHNLPSDVKQQYLGKYTALLGSLNSVPGQTDFNESDVSNVEQIIANEIQSCIRQLDTRQPQDVDDQWRELVEHCNKWDAVYGYNALKLYPELADKFIEYGYVQN